MGVNKSPAVRFLEDSVKKINLFKETYPEVTKFKEDVAYFFRDENGTKTDENHLYRFRFHIFSELESESETTDTKTELNLSKPKTEQIRTNAVTITKIFQNTKNPQTELETSMDKLQTVGDEAT